MFEVKLNDGLCIACGPNSSFCSHDAIHPAPQLGDLSIDARQAIRSTTVAPTDHACQIVLVTVLDSEWPATVALASILPCKVLAVTATNLFGLPVAEAQSIWLVIFPL